MDSCDFDQGVRAVLGSSTAIQHNQRDIVLLILELSMFTKLTIDVHLNVHVRTQRNSDMIQAKSSKA